MVALDKSLLEDLNFEGTVGIFISCYLLYLESVLLFFSLLLSAPPGLNQLAKKLQVRRSMYIERTQAQARRQEHVKEMIYVG
jgi:hypothetical protein